MDIRPYRKIKRRKTKKIKVGNVEVGGDSRIAIQSMTNTITSDAKSTILQILELEKAGVDIEVVHSPVVHLADQDADIYVCHQGLADTAQSLKPDSVVIRFMMFMNDPAINKLVEDLKNGNEIVST